MLHPEQFTSKIRIMCLAALVTVSAAPLALAQGPAPVQTAPVPPAVAMARPTAQELEAMQAGLARILAADPTMRDLTTKYPWVIEARRPGTNTAIVPSLAPNFQAKHQANLAVAQQGDAQVLFMGDSITDFWRNPEGNYAGKPVLDKYFSQWKVANFGIAGDTTQGVLYRLQDGEGKGFSPKAIMLMIGTNNTGRNNAGEIAEGIGAIVLELQKDFPAAKILLLGIFPRGRAATDPARATISQINGIISKLGDGNRVQSLDIGAKFLDSAGNLSPEIMSDALHPTTKGYEIWAQAVIQPLTAMMGQAR
jgi:lysophospholipase L1-like esterase